jgi:hypothetical protein
MIYWTSLAGRRASWKINRWSATDWVILIMFEKMAAKFKNAIDKEVTDSQGH